MQTFKINKELEAVCEWKKTRIAFKHEATLLRNGVEVLKVKINYLNRTWERYTYESVLEKLLEKSKSAGLLKDGESVDFKTAILNGGEKDMAALKSVAMVAALGDIFHSDEAGGSQKARNDWKARMLKAGLGDKGFIMPDDWDTLDEATKQARLDGVLTQLSGKHQDICRACGNLMPYGGKCVCE